MKRFGTNLGLLFLAVGCPAPNDPPVTINRGSGVEAESNVTVVIVDVNYPPDQITAGTAVQRALVGWLNANPEATIKHMNVVGANGSPNEIVLLVEGTTTERDVEDGHNHER